MKKFSFELEKILEYRNFEKQEAEVELAKALAEEGRIKSDLENIAKQLVISNKSLNVSSSFDDVIAQSRYKNLLDYQKEELLKQLAQANIITEEKRSILKECMKKTVALEKLKENQFDEWKKNADYEEAENLEEAAIKRKNKNNNPKN